MCPQPLFFRRRRGSTSLEVAAAGVLVMTGFIMSISLYEEIMVQDTIDRVHTSLVRKLQKLPGSDPTGIDAIFGEVLAEEGIDPRTIDLETFWTTGRSHVNSGRTVISTGVPDIDDLPGTVYSDVRIEVEGAMVLYEYTARRRSILTGDLGSRRYYERPLYVIRG